MKETFDYARFKRLMLICLRYLVLIFTSLLALFPFVWVAFSGFKSNQEIYMNSFGLPKVWKIENYIKALTSTSLATGFKNSLFVTSLVLLLTVIAGSMISYAIAFLYDSRLKEKVYLYFTSGIMIPMTAVLIPMFMLLKQLGLLNTLWGLILVYTASQTATTVFVLTGFMRGIPNELIEAAILDGCSNWQSFWRIIMPLAKPGIATVFTLSFIYCWNEYLLSNVIAGSGDLRTIIVAVYMTKMEMNIDYGLLCANLMISMLPVIVFYCLFQEQVVKGMTSGAVKN